MNVRQISIAVISLLAMVCVMSSDAKDKISDDGLTVSHDASKDPPFEWTLERMLLAIPMPMTGEGRKFLSTHPNIVEGIRTWNDQQFDKYLDSDYAKQHVAEEAVRWRDLARMLKAQAISGCKFLGKSAPEVSSSKDSIQNDKVSIDDIRKMLEGKERKTVLEQMKAWRKQIAELAPKVEAIRKEAEAKGLSDKLENAMSADQ